MTEVVQQKGKVLFAQEESVLAGVRSLEQLDLPTPPDMSYLYTNTSKTLFTKV